MSETSAVQGIVLCHAEMAAGMVQAARDITGVDAEALTPLSNRDCSPETLTRRVEGALRGGPAIVFTDLAAGSCGFTARRLCLKRGEVVVVSGVNLPMLVDFVMHRDMPLGELVPRLMDKGRAGITASEPGQGKNERRALSGG